MAEDPFTEDPFTPDPEDDDCDTDGCVCCVEDEEETSDEDLPPCEGGVA
jgi:hypothetical protein